MRYSLRRAFFNNAKVYEQVLEDRNINKIYQYATPKLRHLSSAQIRKINRLTHIWKFGDRYYKLASKHYGDPKFWWVLAWYNRKPTEAHVKNGDMIYIPLPLERVLSYLGL